jgi:hypothetical protein
MTEEEWLGATSPGTVLDGVRRRARFRAGVAGRKARLAACETLRLIIPQLGNPTWLAPIELTERYIEGHATLAQIEAALDSAEAVALSPMRTTRDALRLLTKPDPFAAANDAPWVAENFLRPPHPDPVRAARDPQLQAAMVAILRDIFGNPFRPVEFSPDWRTSTAVALARGMYESREFSVMPILADALQDAGCDSDDILDHCREPQATHVRGCWVVDLVLGEA